MSQVYDPEAEPLEAVLVSDDPSPAAVIATWLGVGLVTVVVLWFAWTQVINPSGGSTIERYVDDEAGVAYESLRDQFKAEFPTEPTRRQRGGEFGDEVAVTSRPDGNSTFTVIRSPQPENALENYRATLNAAASSLERSFGGEVVEQSPALPLAINNEAVKSLVLRKGDQYQRNQLVLVNGRLYTVQVTMDGDDKAPFERLFETFVVLGPR
jgi:hypothetical protein